MRSQPDESAEYLEELLPHIDEHRTTASEEAIEAASLVTEQSIPQSHTVRERKFLGQQQGDPAEGVKLRIHLQSARSFACGPPVSQQEALEAWD